MPRRTAPKLLAPNVLLIAIVALCCALHFLAPHCSQYAGPFPYGSDGVPLAMLLATLPERRPKRTPAALIILYVLGSAALIAVLVFVRDWMLLAAALTASLAVLARALWKVHKLSSAQSDAEARASESADLLAFVKGLDQLKARAIPVQRRQRFSNALRLLSTLFSLTRAAIFVYEQQAESLHTAANYPESFLPTPSEATFKCVRENQVVRGDRTGTSEIAVPITAAGKVTGVIWASSEAGLGAIEEKCIAAAASVLSPLLASEENLGPESDSRTFNLHLTAERAAARIEEAALERRFLQSILESLHEGVIVAAADGTVVFANPSSLRILSLSEDLVMGRSFLDLLESHRGWSQQEIKASLLDALSSARSFEREVMVRADPPSYYQLRVAAIRGAAMPGEMLGFFATLSDVTKLRESDQVKSDVMSLVSHELRTPLTAIRGYSELLTEMQDLNPTALKCALTINEASQRMSRMLTTFLDVSRLESGKQKLEKRPLHLGEIVRDAIYSVLPLAEERQIDIIDDLPPGLPPVSADYDLMVQVLTNLLSNAIKYSPPGTLARISAEISPDHVRVSVADQGAGIPAEALPRIWEKFYRVQREVDEGTIGSGLGLSFVREIVRQHDGEVDVVSHPGVGSIFSFTLPRS